MTGDDTIWTLERDFWLDGVAHYEQHLDRACLMAFPEPAGILGRAEIIESVREAPRWQSVEMTGRRLETPDDGLRVIAYRAEATRGDQKPYAATCLSTYRRVDGQWLMTSHQQTPIEAR